MTRDGTAEPVSRDRILRRERRKRKNHVLPSVELTTSRIGKFTRLILTVAICVTIHTYIDSLEEVPETVFHLKVALAAIVPTEMFRHDSSARKVNV